MDSPKFTIRHRGRPAKHDTAKIVAAISAVAPSREKALPMMALRRQIEQTSGAIVASTFGSILTKLRADGLIKHAPGDNGTVYWAVPVIEVKVEV